MQFSNFFVFRSSYTLIFDLRSSRCLIFDFLFSTHFAVGSLCATILVFFSV